MEGRERQLLVLDKVTGGEGSGAGRREGKVVEGERPVSISSFRVLESQGRKCQFI